MLATCDVKPSFDDVRYGQCGLSELIDGPGSLKPLSQAALPALVNPP
jgi:hypothetical protein